MTYRDHQSFSQTSQFVDVEASKNAHNKYLKDQQLSPSKCGIFPAEVRTQVGERKDEKQEHIHFKHTSQAQRFSLM